MQPSSTFCRTQEAHQNALAMAASLTNVRSIATLAAAAWAKEAASAERREERMIRRQLTADGLTALELPASEDRAFSENPDRGFSGEE